MPLSPPSHQRPCDRYGRRTRRGTIPRDARFPYVPGCPSGRPVSTTVDRDPLNGNPPQRALRPPGVIREYQSDSSSKLPRRVRRPDRSHDPPPAQTTEIHPPGSTAMEPGLVDRSLHIRGGVHPLPNTHLRGRLGGRAMPRSRSNRSSRRRPMPRTSAALPRSHAAFSRISTRSAFASSISPRWSFLSASGSRSNRKCFQRARWRSRFTGRWKAHGSRWSSRKITPCGSSWIRRASGNRRIRLRPKRSWKDWPYQHRHAVRRTMPFESTTVRPGWATIRSCRPRRSLSSTSPSAAA